MKPQTDNITVEGNLPGASQKFQIDPRALSHILKLLTNLYSNVELAVVRELATNALDSHIQAGITDPIEVTTPSALSNFLVIRDHGVGMSVEELFDLFSMYGASTKRESDEVTGMLGIGSKSPLAYTDSFTLISRKDGVEATVAVTKDEDGVGRLNVVDTRTTNERNGVEIRVPAKAGNRFEPLARNLFRYWDEGSIRLNGQTVKTFEGLDLGGDMWLVESSDQSVVIQGQVPYPAGDYLSHHSLGLPYGYAAVVRVPIGTVDPAPSRELLEFTQRTNTALADIAKRFKSGVQAAVQAKLDNATTMFKAVTVWHKWSNVVNRNNRMQPKWRGKDLPTNVVVPTRQGKHPQYGHNTTLQDGNMWLVSRTGTRRGRGAAQKVPSIEVTYLLRSVFVTNFDVQAFTSRHRERLDAWMATQPDTVKGEDGSGRNVIQHYVLLDFPADLTWLPQERIVDWSVIKAIKLPSRTTGYSTGRIAGSFDLYLGAYNAFTSPTSGRVTRAVDGIPGDKIDQTLPVFYIHGNQNDASVLGLTLDKLLSKYTLVCLPANRIEKFKRDNPHIKLVDDALRDMAAKELAALSADEKMALAITIEGDRSDFTDIRSIVKDIDDPDIKEAVRLVGLDATKAEALRSKFYRVVDLPLPEWDNPLKKYRLLDSYVLCSDPRHVVRYMNAEYAYQQGLTTAPRSGTLDT